MKYRTMKFFIILFSILILISSALHGCKDNATSTPPELAKIPAEKNIKKELKVPQSEETIQDTSTQKGYVYERRGRRDPFMPLIVPTQKWQKKDESKVGTLEGYDLSEFALSAIAKKGTKYFALLVTPDNRSFTVTKGTVIGLSKGKVEIITGDKVVLTEYSRDFRGELRPRQLILEFRKGEVK